ncbi:ZIP family metal transporter [Nanoarchaeota archaeon]
MSAAIYAILSVLLVSAISLVGIFFLMMKRYTLNRTVLFLVSLSAGSLFGGAILHLLPEVVEIKGFTPLVSMSVLAGIILFFLIEKLIHWRHCHVPTSKDHPHHLAPMNLIGDGVHNFIDGLIIAAGYMVSIPVGIATTIAVILHEVPQEIGDFGVLLHAGFSKKKALLFNFLTALTSIVGVVVVLIIGAKSQDFTMWILPFAAGGFLYIAGSDLIPELHKECGGKDMLLHLSALILGIGLMLALKLFSI